MSQASQQASAPSPIHFRRGWIYVLTLALVTINYMDRAALGVVAQSVRGEFGLSPVQMGYLFSSFLWSYVIFLLPIGVMLDRATARNINSIGIALWSLAMAATAGVWSFGSLLVTRLVMGAGSRRARLSLAHLQPDLVRQAGESALAVRCRAQEDSRRAIGGLARRGRRSGQSWRAA